MMKLKLLMAMAIATLVVAVVSCSNGAEEGLTYGKELVSVSLGSRNLDMNDVDREIIAASTAFGWNFFLAGCENNNNENMVLSPLSDYFALSMLANGANGVTYEEIVTALGIDDYTLDDINLLNGKIAYYLQSAEDDVAFHISNSFWHIGCSLKKSYLSALANYYDADIVTISYATLLEDLNNWISAKTDGLMLDFFKDTPSSQFIWLNALYFKAPWSQAFKSDRTYVDSFASGAGLDVVAEYMSGTTYAYYDTEEFEATCIPMGENGSYRMNIFLPKDNVSVEDCASYMLSHGLEQMIVTPSTHVNLSIPKFEVDMKFSIKGINQDLGIKALFGDADLSNMFDGETSIDDALQGLNFKIDEEGVQAAAVTVYYGETSVGDDDAQELKYVDLKLNRPFLYSITENTTGAVLFIGRIDHP